MKILLFLVLALYPTLDSPVFANGAIVFQLQVKHDHFWGTGSGDLTIDQEGITYSSEKDSDHTAHWSYSDIQEMRIESPQEIYIRTYQDVWWKFNGDRTFEFDVVEGNIDTKIVEFLREHLPAQFVSAVYTKPSEPRYSVGVKHKHALGGGCDGELILTNRGVYYHTSDSEHSRFWTIQDIESLGRMSRSNLRITVREHSHSGSIRNFQFQLKGPMDDETYEQLWRSIYEPHSWLTRPTNSERPIEELN